MDLNELQKNWNAFGRTKPFWSILTTAGKWKVKEFFKSGQIEIDALMDHVNTLTAERHWHRALDFGCGVGRLTQALCQYFDDIVGVDIAPSMIDLANKYNRHKGRCQYYLNETDHLGLFASNSFDFIYTVIVLQHMPPRLSKNYIKDFIRILAPGGLLVFQIPAEALTTSNTTYHRMTGATGPLDDSGFNARIRIMAPPRRMKPGSQWVLSVEVTNLSDVMWPAVGEVKDAYKIKLGNHWLDPKGDMFQLDDGRVSLPHDVRPQETVELALAITAPRQEGTYILELDMVQETVTWFKNKGSHTTRLVIKNSYPMLNGLAKSLTRIFNSSRPAHPAGGSEPFTPEMEMHGIPQSEIIAWVEQHGGRIVDIRPDQRGGPDWLSFHYYVSKGENRPKDFRAR